MSERMPFAVHRATLQNGLKINQLWIGLMLRVHSCALPIRQPTQFLLLYPIITLLSSTQSVLIQSRCTSAPSYYKQKSYFYERAYK
jgi:hypothetical protein